MTILGEIWTWNIRTSTWFSSPPYFSQDENFNSLLFPMLCPETTQAHCKFFALLFPSSTTGSQGFYTSFSEWSWAVLRISSPVHSVSLSWHCGEQAPSSLRCHRRNIQPVLPLSAQAGRITHTHSSPLQWARWIFPAHTTVLWTEPVVSYREEKALLDKLREWPCWRRRWPSW